MREIEEKKLLTILATGDIQRHIVDELKKSGIGGYTVVSATGAGTTGLRSGMMMTDSSIIIYIILSEERLQKVLVDLDRFMSRGYRLKAFYQDISIMPRKPGGTSQSEET